MIKKNARQIWIVPVLLALAVLACGPAAEPTGTPLPRPTQVPFPTATTAAAQPTARPTARPTATKAPVEPTATTPAEQATADNSTAAPPFVLATTPFVHKSGTFTITLPAGWTTDEQDHSVFVTSPEKVASIEILFDNAGVKLDATGLNNYIKAVEANWFATFDSYKADNFVTEKDGSILVVKTLKLSDGTPQSVFTYYWQDGTVIYQQTFWLDSSTGDTYVNPLIAVANGMQFDSTAGAKLAAFGVTYTFKDPAKLFQFLVPYGWTRATSKDSTSSVVTFTSPDSRSFVQSISFDNGKPVSKSNAGAFARGLLLQFYKLTDLKITDDKVQKDGSELLVWNSAAAGLDGESYFETRGTTFLLLTWVVNSAAYDTFVPVWKALVQSYAVPQ